jgi:hypothetical protein
MGWCINTIKKNTEALIVASKEIGLEVDTEKCKYVVIFWEQHAVQNHKIKIGNKCIELWNSSHIWEPQHMKIQLMRNFGAGWRKECFLSFSAESCAFHFAIQELKLKIIRSINLLFILYRYEIFLSRRGCSRLWCWGRYLGLSGRRWQGSGENYIWGASWCVLLTKHY